MKSYTFLLGGYDLEMFEIRSLLQAQGLFFVDRQLGWGARWADYQDVIDQIDWHNQQLIGVELSGPKPAQALLIDHHNEQSELPSSIEQVAQLLGLTLSWHQQLVAANDKGYIPGMRELGATEEEIRNIRRLDRQAQGVTEVMERQAEEDCRKINICNHITIVKTELTKFSPIADRLQVPQLLIYNSRTLTYYGQRAAEIGKLFSAEVKAGRMYYGGGPDGFFGVGAGCFSGEEIEEFVKKICIYFQGHNGAI